VILAGPVRLLRSIPLTIFWNRTVCLCAAALCLVAAAAGCAGSPVGPSNFAAFSQSDLRAGTGATVGSTSVIMVNYTGWLYDASQPQQKGPVFDSSLGADPAPTFNLGVNQVIAGWDQGLVGMRVGGLRRLVVPPSLGYGQTRHGIIPPNATLVFEIEILDSH